MLLSDLLANMDREEGGGGINRMGFTMPHKHTAHFSQYITMPEVLLQ